ncbi:MAG: type VI secretion system baseplate subunit TssK [Polyangiales bacterium]
MKPLQRVIWSEGMLISPQHLQQLDRYHETLLEERLSSVTPYGSGVFGLEVDLTSLDEGLFALRSLQVILPRGTTIVLEAGDVEMPKARVIAEHFPATRESIGVYLALTLEREGAVAYAGDDARIGRYLSEPRTVTCEVEGTPQVIAFARRNLRLVFDDEERADSEAIKLAELRRTEAGGFTMVEAYVPACLRVGASGYLQREVHRILGLMVARQRTLAGERSLRDDASVEFNAADVTRFLLLNALNTFIPTLRHIADAGDVSPLGLYMTLSQLAGQLCTFAAQEDPASLPAYKHQQLRDTFEPLFAKLTSLLRANVAGRHLKIALKPREDGLHLAKLNDEQMLRDGVRFVLSVTAPLDPSEVAAQVPRLAKIGSWSQIAKLVNNAVPGVPVRHELRPPKEVPIRPNQVYFSIDGASAHWNDVLRDRSIAVHLPPPFDPQKIGIELFAIPTD